MKKTYLASFKSILSLASLLASCALGFGQGTAPTSDYTNSFDTATSTNSWIYWYGLGFNNTAMIWDPATDANNDPNSGSLEVALPFASKGDQAVWFGTWDNKYGYDGTVIYDGTKFTNITFAIHVDPSSPLNSSGNFGPLQVGLVRQGWAGGGTFDPNSPTIPANATNGWVTLSQTIDQTGAALDTVAGINFKYTSYSGYPTNPITFWIDNIVAHLATVKAAPPKLLSLSTPTGGLNLLSSGSNGDQYQRTCLKLQNTSGNGWLGASGPVTYSLTITNFPNSTAYPGYQAHIFITTGTPADTETDPDYAETNLIFLDIHENANGSAYGAFRYKTNEPQGNTMVYGSGTLGVAGSSTVLGTWSLTFDQNTNITVTAPDGGTFKTNITADAAALFSDPLNVYFGGQPNSPANFGQAVVLSQAGVSGNLSPTNDNFFADGTVLNTNLWTIIAGDTKTVQLFPVDPGALWTKWSLPDTGFGLQISTNLVNSNSWVTLTGPDSSLAPLLSLVAAGSRFVYVPSSLLSPSAAYFRLNQQVFTKLQILLPGETNAPGTVSGKIGTPIPQTLGNQFDITVNAVDSSWHIFNSTDTIHITSTDSSAFLPVDAPLIGGTGTFSLVLNTAGSFTITASDVTDPTKADGTSSSLTISP